MSLLLNCKQATHLLSEALDRPLDLKERLELKLHLKLCTGCRRYQQQMGVIRQACRGFLSEVSSDVDKPSNIPPHNQ